MITRITTGNDIIQHAYQLAKTRYLAQKTSLVMPEKIEQLFSDPGSDIMNIFSGYQPKYNAKDTNPIYSFPYLFLDELAVLDRNLYIEVLKLFSVVVLSPENYKESGAAIEDNYIILYRAQNEEPQSIFTHGFKNKAPNSHIQDYRGLNLGNHATGDTGISTTKKQGIDKAHSTKNEGVVAPLYEIRIPIEEIHKYGPVDVNLSHHENDPMGKQAEVNFIGNIPGAFIYKCTMNNQIVFNNQYNIAHSKKSSALLIEPEKAKEAGIVKQKFSFFSSNKGEAKIETTEKTPDYKGLTEEEIQTKLAAFNAQVKKSKEKNATHGLSTYTNNRKFF